MKIEILSVAESNQIRNKLLHELNGYSLTKNGYWYPLCEISKDVKCISFLCEDLNYTNWKHLYYHLKKENVKKLYEMQEFVDLIRICDIDDCFFDKDENGYDMLYMSECYWFDEDHKCLIYTSHEGTISFTGDVVNGMLGNVELRPFIKDIYYQKVSFLI